jgi:menaquinol-cytochrome c reductase cytochrome b/c subunit
MADIPDHLLKRSAERRKALGLPAKDGDAVEEGAADAPAEAAADTPAEVPAAAAEGPAPDAPAAGGESRGGVPAHLLERAARRRAALAGGDAGAAVPAAAGAGGTATATATRTIAAPTATGPGGHTQRLLTVVKAGSIQDVRSTPTDKVNVWPHLLVVEFVASLAMTAFLLVFSTFVNAPLLGQANYNLTPNPSKAPWYFLGLQELLTLFHPMVAGVMIPGMGLVALGAAGYVDKNPSNKPEDRKFAISIFTLFMMFWAVLVIVGSVFRGEGQNFIYPWRQGVHEIFDL